MGATLLPMRNDQISSTDIGRVLVDDHQRALQRQAELARVRRRTSRRRDAPDSPMR
jgi:hypothetical protein